MAQIIILLLWGQAKRTIIIINRRSHGTFMVDFFFAVINDLMECERARWAKRQFFDGKLNTKASNGKI